MVPEQDHHSLRSLSRATRGGTLDPLRLAEKAYEMGSTACHNAITLSPPEILNLAELEKRALKRAIEVSSGNVHAAAKLLGIGKTTAYRKIHEYGIELRPACCPNCGQQLYPLRIELAA
jgi:transcriptional regulator of acetoin/glycerol metabolism